MIRRRDVEVPAVNGVVDLRYVVRIAVEKNFREDPVVFSEDSVVEVF